MTFPLSLLFVRFDVYLLYVQRYVMNLTSEIYDSLKKRNGIQKEAFVSSFSLHQILSLQGLCQQMYRVSTRLSFYLRVLTTKISSES
jgi:hypothetical protein